MLANVWQHTLGRKGGNILEMVFASFHGVNNPTVAFFPANQCVTTGHTAGKRCVQIWRASMGWLKHRAADSDVLLGLIVLHKPTQPCKESISKAHHRADGTNSRRPTWACWCEAHLVSDCCSCPPGHYLPNCSLSMWSRHCSLLCSKPSCLSLLSLWLCLVIMGCAAHLSSSSSLWLYLHFFTSSHSLCVNPEVGIKCLSWPLCPLI